LSNGPDGSEFEILGGCVAFGNSLTK